MTGGNGEAVNGYHSGIDFGNGEWQTDPPSGFYSLQRYGYFATAGTSQQFRLPAGAILKSIDLQGWARTRSQTAARRRARPCPGAITP